MLEENEIDLLLNDLIEKHGYDFTGYTKPVLLRRINRFYKNSKLVSFAALRFQLSHNPLALHAFINEFTVPVTEMFRDVSFFKFLRDYLLPKLENEPLIRIWIAGCSTGEEAYSVAIIMHELDLLKKAVIYATDINPTVLKIASEAVYPQRNLKTYTENYHLAGGRFAFLNYFDANNETFTLKDFLNQKIVFSTHNLVSDASFNQFQLIICRNVMIYFNTELQNKVSALFDVSLAASGFIALGTKENFRFENIANQYLRVDQAQKIWQNTK